MARRLDGLSIGAVILGGYALVQYALWDRERRLAAAAGLTWSDAPPAPMWRRPAAWKAIIGRTAKAFGQDQIPLIAAGMTFYILLAIFPALAALVSLYGLFADLRDAEDHLRLLSGLLPGGALTVIGDQMRLLIAQHGGALSLAFWLGLGLSVWSANGAVTALMSGLNIASEAKETRGFVRRTATALAFTAGFIVFAVTAFAVLGAAPVVQTLYGPAAARLVGWATWPALLAVMAVGLALLYSYGPNREPPCLRWISWGAGVALVLWLAMSALFSLYAANFGHFNKTYGSLGAVIGFMMWIYLSSMVILAGAELNNEIERQSRLELAVR